MAYLQEIKTECDTYGCHKNGVVEVRNRYNSSYGKFCRRHGTALLRELQEAERRDDLAAETTGKAG